MHEQTIESFRQVRSSVSVSQCRIFTLQECGLIFQRVLNALPIHYILLGTINDTNNTQLDWNNSTAQDIYGIGS